MAPTNKSSRKPPANRTAPPTIPIKDNDTLANTYKALVAAKRKRNQEMLRSMGLLKATKDLKESVLVSTRKKTASKMTRRRTGAAAPTSLRRSSRQSGKPLIFSPEAVDLDGLDRRIKRARIVSSRTREIVRDLTDEQRVSLKKAQNWIDQMHAFLLTVPHGGRMKIVSEDNAKTVIRQVRILASGAGVSYRHWKDGTLFAEHRYVDLSVNLESLYVEAVEFENEHGRDKGNGWLMRHPIVKMRDYQRYRLGEGSKE